MRASRTLAAISLLLSPAACVSHFTTLSTSAGADSWPELRKACAEVARQFEMHDRSYSGLGERPDDQGWYALAFYEYSSRPECEHERIYLLADANPKSGEAQLKVNNFSSGSETTCSRLIRQALRKQLDTAGFVDIEVEQRTERAIGP